MSALTGFAHAGYAALHVRDMLSHGDSDPLQNRPLFFRVDLPRLCMDEAVCLEASRARS